MSLTGSVRATTRADIAKQARDAAAKYYGHNCLVITLSNEQAECIEISEIGGARISASTGYAADWEASVKHHMSQPTYGFAKCISCKYEARN